MSIDTDMTAAGLIVQRRYSDLYVKDTPESRAILAKHGRKVDGWNVQPFRCEVSGDRLLDVPFSNDRGW